MKKLCHTYISNELIYYLIPFVILVFSIIYWPVLFILAGYLWFCRKLYNKKIMLGFLTVAGMLQMRAFFTKIPNEVSGRFMVVEKSEFHYTVQNFSKRYRLYSTVSLSLYEVLEIKGSTKEIEGPRRPGGFNYQTYYSSKSIHAEIVNYQISNRQKIFPDFERVFNLDEMGISKTSQNYVRAFIFNDKSAFKGLIVSSLMGTTSVALWLALRLLKKILSFFNLKEKYQLAIIIPLMILSFILNGKILLIRLSFYMLLGYWSSKLDLKLTRHDFLAIFILVSVLVNPFVMFSQSFIFSTGIVFFLTLRIQKKHHLKDFLGKQLGIQILSLIVTRKTNLLNIIIYPIFSYLSIILTILSFFTLFFGLNVNFIFERVDQVILFASQYQNYFSLNVLKISSAFVTVLCVMWFVVQSRKHEIFWQTTAIIIFVIVCNINFNPQNTIHFYDVGQGDTTIIDNQTERTLIMIDAYQYVSDFMEYRNYTKIDYLFLTHSHLDHVKEVEALSEKYQIDNIYVNEFERFDFPIDSQVFKKGEKIQCGSYTFEALGPNKDYGDSNNNSLVMKMYYKDISFLFTGDIEKKAEDDLVQTYDKTLRSETLHIAHHGSRTSTTLDFLQTVRPEFAIISSGSARYGHPHLEIVERIQKESIFLFVTNTAGTISYNHEKNKNKWYTYL